MKHINKTYWGMFLRFIPLFVIALLFTVSKANADVGERFVIKSAVYQVLTEEDSTGTVAVVEHFIDLTPYAILQKIITIPDSVSNNEKTYSVVALGDYAFKGQTIPTNIVIPDTITSIGKGAFYGCRQLVTNPIPDKITFIESYMFYDCMNLKNINISDNVTFIGESAFYGCASLTNITIPDSITNIAVNTFTGCVNLVDITLSPNITSIGGGAFANCNSLNNIKIPDSVTIIADDTFSNCHNLVDITLSPNTTSIGSRAFANCYSLNNIKIPDSVNFIGYDAFSGCNNLPPIFFSTGKKVLIRYSASNPETSYAIPETVEYIAESAFYNCTNLISISIDSKISSIEKYTFAECQNLTNIEIPDSVTNIQEYAFENCNSLESITIPRNVTSIKDSAFQHCSNLKEINVDPENPAYSSVDGVLFDKSQTTLIKYPPNKEGEYTIPETVCYIEKNAFSECKSSFSLIISGGMEVIESHTFYKLKGLQKVQLPPTLKVIGEDAFFGCVNLKEINIPDSVISIGAGAFANCRSLEQVDIPPYVEEIGDSAFYRCEKLRFAYIPDSLAEVGAYMFNYCHSLESVIIGTSVKEIQVGAFLNCENLNAVYFLGDHPEMGYETFLISDYFRIIRDSQNPRLEPWTNPEVYLDALRENTPVLYYLSDRLGWYPLSQEDALNIISNCNTWFSLKPVLDCCLNYTELEANADDFDYNEGTILSYKGNSPVVVVPDSINGTTVTQIGENAFANSVGVFIIIIPGSVEAIGDNAFANCASLKTVQFRGNAPDAADNIFEGDHCVIYCENGTTGWDAVWKGVTVLSAPESSDNDFTYEINDKEVTITGYTGTATHLEIPAEIEGLPVTLIQEEAFFGRSDIFTVFVPKSVTYVGFGAFANCRNLYSAEFEGETEIEDSAFYHCRNLLEITLPKGLEEVRAYTFTGCNMLQEIDLPSSLTYIGDSSFYKCASLQDIVIPQNVTEIGDSGFTYSGISNALLGSNVGTIGKLAFAGCSNLSNILFGSELETIGELAFADCTDLFDVTLPQYVFEIGDRAFSGCVNLTRITMNDGLKYIGDQVFLGCVSLPEITIPEGVISIGAEVFSGCESLANIWVDEKNLVFSSLDGVLFSNDQTKLIQYPIGREDEVYFIPDGVTRIADKAFQGCTKLTDVRFPDSVSTLEHYVFQYCTNLKRACFEGNAPRLKDSMYVFEGTQVTVYCHEGTSDWDIRNHSCAGRPLFVIPYLDNRLESIGLVLRWVQTDGVALQSSENGIDNWTDITEDILLDNGYCVYRITSMEEAKSFYRLIVP